MRYLLLTFTLTASISPLLTCAHLFQLKEWRWDRLREHLHAEGYFQQLFGLMRPTILGIFGLFGVFGFSSWPLAFLLTTTLLNIVQVLLRKQPSPTWTSKALVLTGTSLFITTLCSISLTSNAIAFLPILQPLALAMALVLFSPLDYFLKQRILEKAKNLRLQCPNLTVIGITGSVGKTTTKELLTHLLQDLSPLATPEHVNTELGVAKWLIKRLEPMCHGGPVEPSHRHSGMSTLRRAQGDTPSILIVEMGAYSEGEIATLCRITQPTIGIITWIGSQHIGLFRSQKAIAEAKGELFAALPASGQAFLNIDSPFAEDLRKKCSCAVTTVSAHTAADIQAKNTAERPEGVRFMCGNSIFTSSLHGDHQIGNILLAIAAAEKLGISRENIAQKLQTFQTLQHTFSVREQQGVTILDDTHNASPESLCAAIEWARHQPLTPKILITSGIIEQGSASGRTHFRCGNLAKNVFDEAFVLNKKLAQYFAEGFGKPVHYLKPITYNLTPGSLLVCVGRLPQTIIEKLLP